MGYLCSDYMINSLLSYKTYPWPWISWKQPLFSSFLNRISWDILSTFHLNTVYWMPAYPRHGAGHWECWQTRWHPGPCGVQPPGEASALAMPLKWLRHNFWGSTPSFCGSSQPPPSSGKRDLNNGSNILKPNSSHLEIILPFKALWWENLPLKRLRIRYHVAQIQSFQLLSCVQLFVTL